MIITSSKITNLSDIDFDAFFEASLPILDAEENHWPVGVTSYADKKTYTIASINMINGLPTAFSFKINVNDFTVVATFGFIDNGQHNIIIGLLRDDANNSRSYVYDPAFAQAIKSITMANGASSGSIHFYTGSQACETFKNVYNATESDLTYVVSERNPPVTILRIW